MEQKLFVKNILIFYLYLSFATPKAFLLIGLPMILYIEGFTPFAIGLFSLTSIPYITAFLFSPIIDGFVFEKNHYKKWIGIFAFIYLGLIFFLSYYSLKEDYFLIFFLILFIVFISTFLDTSLNALATKIFTKEEQSSAGGFKSSAYFTSSIIGNGFILLLYNSYGWDFAILSIISLNIPSFFILYYIQEQKSKVEKQTIPFKQISNFFKQKQIFQWIMILATYFMFLFPLWIFLKPYLLSKGLEPDTVAILAGLLGSSIAAIGSLGFSFFSKNIDKKLLLFRFSVFNFLVVGFFIILEVFTLSLFFIVLCVTFIALSMGLSNSILFALIMHNCRKEYKAIDYSVQLSIDATGRIFAGMIAGMLIEMFTYKGLFLICFLGIIMVLFLVYRYLHKPI